MKKKLTDTEIDEIVKILDSAIQEGPWESSNFLKNIGKNLREIRQDFLDHVTGSQRLESKIDKTRERFLTQRSHKQEIFITLYSSEGGDLAAWERVLANLPKQFISRPIYEKEEDALYVIRSKENRTNEAYVSVFIDSDDILAISSDKTPMDKFGKALLTLKDRAVVLENINRFIHLMGNFEFVKGRLVKKS